MDLPSDMAEFKRHYLALSKGSRVPTLRTFIDNAPYHLMPRITITDRTKPNEMRSRFFGSAVAEILGKDYTGYLGPESPEAGIRHKNGNCGWIAAHHPCGYFSQKILRRGVRTSSVSAFFLLVLGLPLQASPDLMCLASYHSFPDIAPQSVTEADEISSITPLAWVDIGFGVPALKL